MNPRETNPPDPPPRPSAVRFDTTRWSLVLAAGSENTSSSLRLSLAELCEIYWYPLYAFLRRRGFSAQDAEDSVQGFFARFLEKNYLAVVSPEKGKFRSYLLGALKHFLANESDRKRAGKRGGGRKTVSLEFEGAEKRYGLHPGHELTPERIFDRNWALALLDRVLTRLREERCAAGKAELFDRLVVFLDGASDTPSRGEVATEFGMSEGAVKVAVHRLRGRYREILKEEVAGTLAGPEETEEEIRYLLAALST